MGSSCLGIMPVGTEQWHAKIGHFNGCLRYAVIKLKLNLFHSMASVSQVLLFLLAIILQHISKDNTASCFLTSFVLLSHLLSKNSHFMLFVYVSNSDISLNRFLICIILLIWSMYPLVILYYTTHWLFYTAASTFALTWRYRK